MDISYLLNILLSGFQTTVIVFFVTLIGALPIGVLFAICRTSKFKPLALIARFFISVLRGTPLMLQLMAWCYAPYYVFHLNLGNDWTLIACCIGFILNYSAYFGEIYRSGIQSIPKGQYEAAQVLGYSHIQTFIYIILPQVIKRILPAVGNEIIALVKDTSLAFVLGIAEMFTAAKSLAAKYVSMLPYAIAALIYWCFTLLVEFILNRAEKKLSYYHD